MGPLQIRKCLECRPSGQSGHQKSYLSNANPETLVLIRFQGLHPPWVKDADWEFLMWYALAMERNRSWSAALTQTDPRHPVSKGTHAKVIPDPVIIECSGLGGGDLNLA